MSAPEDTSATFGAAVEESVQPQPTEANLGTSDSNTYGPQQDDIERIRAKQEARLAAGILDKTVGGLLSETGHDLRQHHDEGEGDKEKQRRRGQWRGMSLAADASLQWDFAIETFDYKIQAMVLGSDLRVYLVFIVMFCFFFLIARDINQNHYFSKAVRDPIIGSEIAYLKFARFFDDISEAAEFNRYVLDVILIQGIDLEYVTGPNYFIGAMRFRTQRVRKDSCTINTAIIPESMPAGARECYGAMNSDSEDKGEATNRYNQVRRWKYRRCSDLEGGSPTTGMIATYDCGGYVFEVPWWRPATSEESLKMPFPSPNFERLPIEIAENLYIKPALENDPPFIDNLATRFVIVEFFAYNPTLKTFLGVKLFAEAAAGGLWIPNYQFRIFEIWTKADIGKTVYDAFFYAFVFYYIYQFFADLVRFHRREKKILAFFLNTWNLMEFANLSIFVAVLVFRILWILQCTKTDIDLAELTYTQKYPVILDDILYSYMFQVYLNSVNTVLTFLKLLKFFRLNDRLNILTRTLAESQDSIIGVLFIFLLVVTAFAMTGHGLFGLGVWRFRSVDASFSTLLLMLLGQFDYEEIKNENRVQAGFFFWSYIILGLFCLLNFLIGVLMEAFAEVSSTKPILPLESVLVKTWSDWKRILHPRNLLNTFVQRIKGNTKEVMLTDAVEMLRAYRDVKYPPETTDVPIDKQMMTLDDYENAIDPELIEKIGRAYMAYIWDDLVYEWDLSKDAQEAIESQRNLEMTTRGVRAAIGAHLDKIEGFSTRMSNLEKDLADLIFMLEGR